MEQEKTHLNERQVLQITAVNATCQAASYVHKDSILPDMKS